MLIPRTNIMEKIDAALEKVGYVDPLAGVDKRKAAVDAREALVQNGATLENVIGNIVGLMNNSEIDAVRLKASEHCLTIHGVNLKEVKEGQNTQINVIFNNVENGAERLQSVLCPER
jgi:hypothetical protein